MNDQEFSKKYFADRKELISIFSKGYYDSRSSLKEGVVSLLTRYGFPRQSNQFYEELLSDLPVEELTKGWRLKPLPTKKKKFSWDDVRLIPNSLDEVISDVLATEDLSKKDLEFVERQVKGLKSGNIDKFKAILIEEGGSVIDGHHRLLIASALGQKQIPAQMLFTSS